MHFHLVSIELPSRPWGYIGAKEDVDVLDSLVPKLEDEVDKVMSEIMQIRMGADVVRVKFESSRFSMVSSFKKYPKQACIICYSLV